MAYGIGVITMVEGIEQVKIKCKLYRSFALSLNVIRKALSIEHLWVDQINFMDFYNRGSGTRSKLGDIASICSGALEFHRMQARQFSNVLEARQLVLLIWRERASSS